MMRPGTYFLVGLSVAIAAKIGIAVLERGTDPDGFTPRETFFIASAEAAGAAPDKEETAEASASEPMQCEETPEELLRSIRQERQLMATQREKLAQRAAELDLTAESLELEQARLTELKTALDGLLEKVERAHTADVDRLVALYQNMKPKDAANIMNDLDLEVTVMVLGTMNERNAAPILASLDPVRARAISQIILERSKLPGDQRLDDIKL